MRLKDFLGVFVFCFVLAVDYDSLGMEVTYLQSVPNSAEHWLEIDTPYNEDNKGKLYELQFEKAVENNQFPNINQYYYISSGHIINSQYDPTDVLQFGGRACTTDLIYYCWAFGVMGFKGYEDQPKMLEGFYYVPSFNHDIGVKVGGFSAKYRQYWLINAVSSEFYGLSYDLTF